MTTAELVARARKLGDPLSGDSLFIELADELDRLAERLESAERALRTIVVEMAGRPAFVLTGKKAVPVHVSVPAIDHFDKFGDKP